MPVVLLESSMLRGDSLWQRSMYCSSVSTWSEVSLLSKMLFFSSFVTYLLVLLHGGRPVSVATWNSTALLFLLLFGTVQLYCFWCCLEQYCFTFFVSVWNSSAILFPFSAGARLVVLDLFPSSIILPGLIVDINLVAATTTLPQILLNLLSWDIFVIIAGDYWPRVTSFSDLTKVQQSIRSFMVIY